MHGGPLWEPLCYAQIGGLTFATFVTLLLVPVLYAIFVLDLKIVKWEKVAHGGEKVVEEVAEQQQAQNRRKENQSGENRENRVVGKGCRHLHGMVPKDIFIGKEEGTFDTTELH